MAYLFSLTLFLSAFLLFWVQLMVGKMILPLLGGSPSVWNTCLVFFQAILLFGYGYSHLVTRLGLKAKLFIHCCFLLIPLAFLPITLTKDWLPPQSSNPIFWLLALLLISVGIPFFVVATSAPLIQKWFAETNHPDSNDPYFLYSASNLGSLLGVLSYPILIEPNLTLTQQSWGWSIVYGVMVLMTIGCGMYIWRSPNLSPHPISTETPLQPPTIQQKLQWVILSFIPSSLLLGVTTYITTDIAAIPLLWSIPLALYLLSFVLTFARKSFSPQPSLTAILPLGLTALIILSLLRVMQPIWLILPFHLIGFFITAYVLHGELAQSRPNSEYLTSFYLWIAVGGVCGGLFNAIASPLLFPTILEYPLVMGLSIIILRTNDFKDSKLRLNQSFPISIGILLGSLLVGFQLKYTNSVLGAIFAILILITIRYAFKLHSLRFSVGLVFIILLSQFYIPSLGKSLATERSFFGVNRVLSDRLGYHSLLHGTTVHGKQSLDPQRRQEPLTYFSPSSPVGQVFKEFEQSNRFSKIAVMGLGIGTLAAYSKPEQEWTFYEIDPVVEKLAKNSNYFTFLEDAEAPYSIILGDARLRLGKAQNNYYDLLVMDAFSSDSIPVHLITKEAIQMYLTKLTESGLLLINISNRYINLEPILGTLAKNLGLFTLKQLDINVTPEEKAKGKSASHWVIMARQQKDFGTIMNDSRWKPILDNSLRLWTDDFSNVFQVLNFKSRY